MLTEEKFFERLEFENPLDIALRALNLRKTLLFLGYDIGDVNVRYMIYKLHKMRLQATKSIERPIGIMVTFTESQVQRCLLEKWEVQTIVLDRSQRDLAMDEFLEMFA